MWFSSLLLATTTQEGICGCCFFPLVLVNHLVEKKVYIEQNLCSVWCETFLTSLKRDNARPNPDRVPYPCQGFPLDEKGTVIETLLNPVRGKFLTLFRLTLVAKLIREKVPSPVSARDSRPTVTPEQLNKGWCYSALTSSGSSGSSWAMPLWQSIQVCPLSSALACFLRALRSWALNSILLKS